MTIALLTLAGTSLIVVLLVDAFHELFHPSGHGGIRAWISHLLWGWFRRFDRRRGERLSLAGPIIMVTVIMSWTWGLVLGWSFLIWAQMPHGFKYATGLSPQEHSGFSDAFYVSIAALVTVGASDIAPLSTASRIMIPLESLVGFALLSVTVSWVLSIYPVVSRRRSLAEQLTLLRDAERDTQPVGHLDDAALAGVLSSITERLIDVRGDLLRNRVSYFFEPTDERVSLPAALPIVLDLIDAGSGSNRDLRTRFRAAELRRALERLCETLASDFLLCDAAPESVLPAYAEDHNRERVAIGRVDRVSSTREP